ncbi:DNA replication/repair protein RecF [Aerococcaceae bacterium zg-ZJ1578]|uniref:DNA replication/repair protein RecF n=1 Tax=Aerococcaceae bacterium zg-252 TaxID=2796928 RepID=UPI001A212868|nr:DNA replication/repair protein RecF [Aerococcaceae bacterium zg-1578]MBR7927840.1 DNA replication/repair protein RecF [Aerococcaceae bacterium zg-ZUI334]
MKIKQLNLQNYRNYQHLDLTFNDGLTIFTGENAQGKTNLVEAIFLLSLAKSHRTNRDYELIKSDAEGAKISALVETNNFELPLELFLNKKGKVAKVNHIEQAKLSHFVGQLNVILFAPEDMQLIKGSPALRRRFLDIEIGQSQPIYLVELLQYNRILKQRNQYLKQFGRQSSFDSIYFEVLTEQLIEKAVNVINYRLNYISHLEKIAQPIHFNLSNQRDSLKLEYVSSSSKLNYEQKQHLHIQLTKLFHEAISREKEMGVTAYGPHRDDLIFYVNEQPAQFFGSQGQQRTIVLSIKLAEIEFINQIKGEYPILLLDDVLSELDDNRQHLLMQYIEGKVQTFLTTASIKGLKLQRLNYPSIFYIENGTVQVLKDTH